MNVKHVQKCEKCQEVKTCQKVTRNVRCVTKENNVKTSKNCEKGVKNVSQNVKCDNKCHNLTTSFKTFTISKQMSDVLKM